MRQPPVHSPLPWAALRAGGAALMPGRDPRPALAELLKREFVAERVRLLASGTQALQTALSEAARAVGGEVIVALPAFTCFDVATAAVGAGVRVALYDVDPRTLSPDLDSLTAALTAGARIVVVTPLYGVPVPWRAVVECAAAVGATVIEDAAQGFAASWRGRPLGSLGVVSVLSFGRGKGWTGGRGGALLSRGGAGGNGGNGNGGGGEGGLWREAGVLALAAAQWPFARPAAYGIPASIPWLGLGETRYLDPVTPGALSRASAGLLMRGFAAALREAGERRRRARRLLEALALCPGVHPIDPPAETTPGYLRLPLRVPRGLSGLIEPEAAMRLGAAPSYPSSLGDLAPIRARLVGQARRWPGAQDLVRDLITLPTHSLLSPGDLEALARAVAR